MTSISTLDDSQLTNLITERISSYDIRKEGPYPETEPGFKRAAVLLPLSVHNGQVFVWLTKRSKHLRTHPSAASFPGGKRDETDCSDIEAALREADEEIGLSPDKVQVLGVLLRGMILPNMVVYPVVGLIPHYFKPTCNPSEVDFAFYMPLTDFLDEKKVAYTEFKYKGQKYRSRAIHYQGEDGQKAKVWGFTSNFCLLLAKIIFNDTGIMEEMPEEQKTEDVNSLESFIASLNAYFEYVTHIYKEEMKSKNVAKSKL